MFKNSIFILFILITDIYGEFREITPLEEQILFTSQEKSDDVENNKSIENKIVENIESKDTIKAENLSKEITQESVHVIDKEEVKETIKNNSIPVITEEQLKDIIAHSKNSPLPESSVETDKRDFYSLDLDKRADQPYIFQEIGKTLDKYSFSDKSEDSYGGRVTTKEITSDRVIENLEFGVGIAYENTEYYDSQYEKQNSDIWTHTPVYATGKYKLSSDEESTKYLKLNLGYAIGEYENLKEYNEIRNQSGMYYGVGGGIEYSDISLDLIYQVNKDAYERDNSSQDDSRITFSVDYKLDF